MHPSVLAPGTIIDHSYLLEEKIGSGGMGDVFKAWQERLERHVAIKVLKEECLNDPQFKTRFEREAKALSMLAHRNIVTFYAFGFIDGRWPYIAMEYAEGLPLSEILSEHRISDEKQLFSIADQLCDALAHAHQQGIIHRDLKPGNINLLPDGTVKMMDFGLTKITCRDADSQKITAEGSALGSFHFMSPETCSGANADERTDIYALGCVLYACMSGVPPFDSATAAQVMFQHLYADPEQILGAESEAPATLLEFQQVIFNCLQKDPADRYQSAKEMKQALSKAASALRSDNGKSISPSRSRSVGSAPAMLLAAGSLCIIATFVLIAISMVATHDARMHVQTIARSEPIDYLKPPAPQAQDVTIGVPNKVRRQYNDICADANALFERGAWPLAAKAMDKAVALAPLCANAFAMRGWYRTLCSDRQAITDLNQAIRLNPNDWQTYYHRAVYFKKYNQPQSQLQEVNRALTLKPSAPFLYELRAEAFDKLGMPAEASRNRDIQWQILRTEEAKRNQHS